MTENKMNVWIKPSELPEKFFGECWVCWRSWSTTYEPRLRTVQNVYRGVPEYYDEDGYRFLSDNSYRLIINVTPEKPADSVWE